MHMLINLFIFILDCMCVSLSGEKLGDIDYHYPNIILQAYSNWTTCLSSGMRSILPINSIFHPLPNYWSSIQDNYNNDSFLNHSGDRTGEKCFCIIKSQCKRTHLLIYSHCGMVSFYRQQHTNSLFNSVWDHHLQNTYISL
jgi:hypothetical protein